MSSSRPLLTLALLLAGLATTPARAEPPATQPAGLRALDSIRDAYVSLAATDAVKRRDARVTLMGLSRADLPRLAQVVQDNEPVVPSQAAVLRDVVTQVFLATEPYDVTNGQGFLGLSEMGEIEMSDPKQSSRQRTGVSFGDRQPGFNAYRWLDEGDVILEYGTQALRPVQSSAQFTTDIKSLPPGTLVTLRVLRGGQPVTVRFPLSPRPAAADTGGVLTFKFMMNERVALADAYWRKHFAPLIEPDFS